MKDERHLWNKHFMVLRPAMGLLRPIYIAMSEVSTPHYHLRGRGRRKTDTDIYVFQYTLAGRGVFVRKGKQHDLSVGKGFFCKTTDELVSYYFPDDATEPWRFLFLTISDSTGCAESVNEQFGYVFDIEPSEHQMQLLLSYKDVPERSIQIDAGAAHVFANSLIGMLVDQAQCETRHRGASLRVVKQALDAIEAMIGQSLNARILAKKIGVSQEHLNRIFRTELGRTPYQCICEAKMRRACELLKGTDQTIANIAVQLGYGPDSHFGRLFKRIMGVSPGQFRNGSSMPIHQIIKH